MLFVNFVNAAGLWTKSVLVSPLFCVLALYFRLTPRGNSSFFWFLCVPFGRWWMPPSSFSFMPCLPPGVYTSNGWGQLSQEQVGDTKEGFDNFEWFLKIITTIRSTRTTSVSTGGSTNYVFLEKIGEFFFSRFHPSFFFHLAVSPDDQKKSSWKRPWRFGLPNKNNVWHCVR